MGEMKYTHEEVGRAIEESQRPVSAEELTVSQDYRVAGLGQANLARIESPDTYVLIFRDLRNQTISTGLTNIIRIPNGSLSFRDLDKVKWEFK
ncbi:MAG: hypothetical protein AABY10_01605 [Nanoarchaeota archaeon]